MVVEIAGRMCMLQSGLIRNTVGETFINQIIRCRNGASVVALLPAQSLIPFKSGVLALASA